MRSTLNGRSGSRPTPNGLPTMLFFTSFLISGSISPHHFGSSVRPKIKHNAGPIYAGDDWQPPDQQPVSRLAASRILREAFRTQGPLHIRCTLRAVNHALQRWPMFKACLCWMRLTCSDPAPNHYHLYIIHPRLTKNLWFCTSTSGSIPDL